MKKLNATIAAVLISMSLFAQNDEIRTIFSDVTISKVRGFGGPTMTFTTINGDFAHMTGGGGGIILNDKFFIGGFGSGTTNRISATVSDTINTDIRIQFSYGGLWLGYIFKGSNPIHPVFHCQIGGGSFNLLDNDAWYSSSNYTNSDGVFVLNPTLELETNITKFFRLGIGANYRLVFGVNEFGYENSDFSGPGGFMSFKFGWF